MSTCRHDDPRGDYTPLWRSHPSLKVPLILLVGFLLTLMATGAGFLHARVTALDERKADKEVVKEIAQDVREIRQFLLGPRRGAY